MTRWHSAEASEPAPGPTAVAPTAPTLHLEWRDAGGSPRRLPAPEREAVIGRDPDADICLCHTSVSWHHARVSHDGRRLTIMDLGSTNGTWLNGRRLDASVPAPAGLDDVVRIGPHEIVVRVAASQDHGGAGQTECLPLPAAAEAGSHAPIVIGRAPDCGLVLDHPSVSWRHAVLRRTADGWEVEDMASTNGTFVNERRVHRRMVATGDRVRIGPHRVRIAADQVSSSSDSGNLRIEARGLTHTVPGTGRGLTILHNISLSIAPRQLVAIVGASGSGKTTLLLALNGYQPASRGQVLLNGVDLYAHPDIFRTAVGYVPQSDIVHADLSVESALRYAARLRLPPDTTDSEIAGHVARVLHALELADRRRHFVRTLSGGERKRVNIGVELLTRPGILFLDEPTTGLDAGLERRIVHLLRALADQGTTVLSVTHSVQTIEEYDCIAVVTRGGYLAFFGAPREALEFFGVRTYAEMYDIANNPALEPGYWSRRSSSSSHAPHAPVASKHRPSTPPGPIRSGRGTGAAQFRTLLLRALEVARGDTRNLIFWAAQAPIIGLVMAVLFQPGVFGANQAPDATGHMPIQEGPQVLFLLAFSIACFALFNAAREVVKEKAIYLRERHACLAVGPYLASKAAVLALVAVGQSVLLLALVSFRIDLGLTAASYGAMLLVMSLGGIAATALGLLTSAWAATNDQAITIAALALLVQVVFSGLVPLQRMDPFMQAAAQLCPLRWAYGGLCGVAGLADRWSDAGLGSQINDVFRTSPTGAALALAAMAGLILTAAWLLLRRRDGANKRERRL